MLLDKVRIDGGVSYLLRSHGRRVVVLRRRLHLDVGRRHVGGTRKRGDGRRRAVGLGRVGVGHVAALRLERGGHAAALTRTVTELVVGRVAHLVVVVGVVAASASALVVAAVVVALDRMVRFTSEVRAGLVGGAGLGDGSLSYVTLA